MSIQPLPPEVVAQIKSSTTITSLNGAIFELVKNSLDAGAVKLDITVDYSRGSCIVEDNGLGILPSEFNENGGLGKMHHSSHLNSPTLVHGERGAFIASLSAMSLLSVTSHHFEHRSHNMLTMHKSKVISRQAPAPPQHHLSSFDHGTCVTVRDLFGSMPVRVKQRVASGDKQGANVKEWESLKRELVMLVLAWPEPISLVLREQGTSRKVAFKGANGYQPDCEVINIQNVSSILSQAALITPEERSSWVSVSASTQMFDIFGAISLSPIATKYAQFIAISIKPVIPINGNNILYDEINRLFQNSAYGNEEESAEQSHEEKERRAHDGRYRGDGFTNKELKGRKGVDRWPMFYINIRPRSRARLVVDDILDDRSGNLSDIIDLLQAMIVEFLTQHHFRPKLARFQRVHKSVQSPSLETPMLSSPKKRILSPNFVPSGSGKRVKAGKRSRIMDKPKFDLLLGTTVKLPSFRRTLPLPESPFDGWSRMKSGTAISRTNGALPPEQSSYIDKTTATALPPSTKSTSCRSSTSRSTLARKPLTSSTGKIVRSPFDDVTALKDQGRPFQTRPLPKRPSDETAIEPTNGGDETVMWMNPITKVESLVNSRTGLTVRATNQRATRNSTDLTPHPRFPASSSGRISMTSKSVPVTNPKDASPWISSLLKTWDNPIFQVAEPPIPCVSIGHESEKVLHGHRHHCTQVDIDKAFKEQTSGLNGKISKDALRDTEVLGQVDKKFILAKVKSGGGELLVIIDQHAADERVRIEGLMAELCQPPAASSSQQLSAIITSHLDKPLIFEVKEREARLLDDHKAWFARWGIIFDVLPAVSSTKLQQIAVRSLPPGILERCKLSPHLLLNLLRTEVHTAPSTTAANPISTNNSDWLTKIHGCPQSLLDMLNSRACRSAIMFNDELSKAECEALVKRLAACKFPFMCAHGRPSLVPLVELGGLEAGGMGCKTDFIGARDTAGSRDRRKEGLQSFGRAFKRWKNEEIGG